MDKTIHKLKTWPAYFLGLRLGMKNFEVRVNDRDYQVGDFLLLQEFIPSIGYTGKEIERQITYILKGGEFGIAEDTVVMSLSQWPPQQAVSDEEITEWADMVQDDRLEGAYAAYNRGRCTGRWEGARWMRDRTPPSEAETILRRFQQLMDKRDSLKGIFEMIIHDEDYQKQLAEVREEMRKWCADNPVKG